MGKLVQDRREFKIINFLMGLFKDNFIKKIIAILSCFMLFACSVRAPQTFKFNKKKEIVENDLKAINKIKTSNNNYRKGVKIDLYSAIALAIKNNKNLKVRVLESALADQRRENVKYDMLPGMAANAGYSGMDKYEATTSSTVTGDSAATPGTSYSTSKEKTVADQRIGFSWNVLDFGLSYIRAGQQGDRYLIAQELERKAAHNITREVIRAYWNTYYAQQLLKEYDPLIVEVKKALNDSKKIEELLLQKPMDALRYQKELLDIQRALQTQKQVLINSKVELGSLMGLLPNEKFTVVKTQRPLTNLKMPLGKMEEYALLNRPEMNEKHYQERISLEDTRANMRSLLPGVSFTANFTNSDNTYLKNKSNLDYGTSVGGNLLNVFKAPSIKKMSEQNTEVIREQRLAVAMTVLSQVHLASIDYGMALEELETSQKYLDVSQKITDQVRNAQKIARFGNLELIREQASLLVAKLKRALAYAQMQHAIGTMYSSLGIDVTKSNINKHGKKLAEGLTLEQHASMIQENFVNHSEQYRALVKNPIQDQNPVVKNARFSFKDDTFELQGNTANRYQATLENDEPLPNWLVFLPSQRTFYVRKELKGDVEELKIKVMAKNIYSEAEDQFVLLVDPELRAERIAKEKKALAMKQEQEQLKVKQLAQKEEKSKQTQKEEQDSPIVQSALRQIDDEDQNPILLMKKTFKQAEEKQKNSKKEKEKIESKTIPGLRDDLSNETNEIVKIEEDELDLEDTMAPEFINEPVEEKKFFPLKDKKTNLEQPISPKVQMVKLDRVAMIKNLKINPYQTYAKQKLEEFNATLIPIEVQRNILIGKDGKIEMIKEQDQPTSVEEKMVEIKKDIVEPIQSKDQPEPAEKKEVVVAAPLPRDQIQKKMISKNYIVKAGLNTQIKKEEVSSEVNLMKEKLDKVKQYIQNEKNNKTYSEKNLDHFLAMQGMNRYVQLASYEEKKDAEKFKKLFSDEVGGLSIRKDQFSKASLYKVMVGPLDHDGVQVVTNNLNNLSIGGFIVTIE